MPSFGVGRSLMGGRKGNLPLGNRSSMFTFSSILLDELELALRFRSSAFIDAIAVFVLCICYCSSFLYIYIFFIVFLITEEDVKENPFWMWQSFLTYLSDAVKNVVICLRHR